MQNSIQKNYNELLAQLQTILRQIEEGNSSPDQWESQLTQAQSLLEACRQRLRAVENAVDKTLSTRTE